MAARDETAVSVVEVSLPAPDGFFNISITMVVEFQFHFFPMPFIKREIL